MSSALVALLALGCNGLVDGTRMSTTAPTATGGSAAGFSGAAGSGDGTAGGSTAGAGPAPTPVVPGAATLPRLTVAQYANAIARLFSPNVLLPELEADNNPDFYAVIGAAREPVSETGVNQYWEAAKDIAEQVAQDANVRSKLLSCGEPATLSDPCVESFLDTTGRRLFRRPLSAEERARYSALLRDTAEGDLWQGIRFALTAMLASPNFLYREERTLESNELPGARKFDDYAMASRLSFLTVNDGPDDTLLDKAAAGALGTPELLVDQLDRLYPDAIGSGLRNFFDEYLELEKSGNLDFEGVGPMKDAAIRSAMRDEVLALAADAAEPGVDFRQLLTTRSTHLNAPLASLYGLAGVTSSALVPFTLPENSHRGGLLTTGAFLTAESAQDRTKPTNRGFFVQVRLLCTSVPDPPDNVPPLEEAGDPVAKSVRDVLTAHRANPSCAGCHQLMDPIGLGMEDFDQFGRYRVQYADGSPVDASSAWNGKTVIGAAQLGAALAEEPRLTECVARQLFRYATARRETDAEATLLQRVHQQFVDDGYELQALLRAIVKSESFRFAGPESEGSQ